MTSVPNAVLRQECDETLPRETSTQLMGRARADAIAELATRPSVVAGKALSAFDKAIPDVAAVVNMLEYRLAHIDAGDTTVIREILGSQVFILQGLIGHCAWRLGSAQCPDAVRVFGGLLLTSQRQLCQTVQLLESMRPPEGADNANELLEGGEI